MHIFIYGPSGSGKTTVAGQLARSLSLPLVDLDCLIEERIGDSITNFMQARGEAAFREIESDLLRESVQGVDKIISLGGGAFLRDENRKLAEEKGQVVFLHTDITTLVSRLSGEQDLRPLLAGDLAASLEALLKERAEHYASFPLRVDASQSPFQTAWDIQCVLGRFHLRSMPPAYDAIVQPDGLDQLGAMLKARELHGPILLVSDSNVAPLYAQRVLTSLEEAGYAADSFTIQAGEAHKGIDTVMAIWSACLHAGLERKSTILALGGGVVGDLSGFAAATFMRGCRWVGVPTTLLSMVDASLGGKTGFDLPQGKNLAGAFYSPRLVLADPRVLTTLPMRELRAGMAEVVKHGVIADPYLFELCSKDWKTIERDLPEIVRRAMAVKVKVIEEDPFEQNIRASLNFGHTIGHALESASGYTLLHGEAVALGMLAETRLAEKLAIAENGLWRTLENVLAGLELAVRIPADIERDTILSRMQVDKKKSQGKIRFALPERIGKVRVGIEVDDLPALLEEIL